MTNFRGGPATTGAEDRLLADIAGRVFGDGVLRSAGSGETPQNALATYNLAATARILNLAAEHGVPAKDLLEPIGVSTGQSWMSDDFVDVSTTSCSRT